MLAVLAGALAAMAGAHAHAQGDEDADFLEFLEYLGSWEESDADWEQFIEDGEADADTRIGAPFEPYEPGEDSEDEDVVS